MIEVHFLTTLHLIEIFVCLVSSEVDLWIENGHLLSMSSDVCQCNWPAIYLLLMRIINKIRAYSELFTPTSKHKPVSK